jgi:predicted nucleic acid-binding protein
LEREEIQQYVTDASIAVKWFVDEADSSKARKLKSLYLEGAINLEAPSLLNYEVASALRFHPVAKLTSSQFRTVMDSLEELQIARDPTHGEWTTALTLSLENAISMYDAVYVAFALQGNAKMVTADKTLIGTIKGPEIKARLISLEALDMK